MQSFYKKIAIGFVCMATSLFVFAQVTSKEWQDKADKHFIDKKYVEAAEAYDKTSEIDQKNQHAFYMAGWCYNDMEKFPEAIDRLKKAVALNSADQLAWQELGYAYKKTSKNPEAVDCFKKAIAIRPTYALAYKQLGDVYRTMGLKADGITAYKSCYENNNKNDDACYYIGYLYNSLAEYDNAIEWLNKARTIKERADVYNEIGFALYKQKKSEEAIEAYKNTIKINEKNGTAYKGIGDVYRLLYSPAKVDDALTYYLKAIEYNPKSSGSYYGLGWCYNEKSKYEEAIPLLNKSIELDKVFVGAYTELGYAQYMTNKYTDGLNTLKAGIAQDNKNILCRYYSGLIYVKQNDKSNATNVYNELKPLDTKLADKLLVKISTL